MDRISRESARSAGRLWAVSWSAWPSTPRASWLPLPCALACASRACRRWPRQACRVSCGRLARLHFPALVLDDRAGTQIHRRCFHRRHRRAGPGRRPCLARRCAELGIILASYAAGAVPGGIIMLRFLPQRILLAAMLPVPALSVFPFALAVPLTVAWAAGTAFLAGGCLEVFWVSWTTAMTGTTTKRPASPLVRDEVTRCSRSASGRGWTAIPNTEGGRSTVKPSLCPPSGP
jgi:hypothetical protein